MATHNELKKGTKVKGPGLFGQGPREAEIVDNKKGVTRCIKVEETNGHFGDIGDTYIDEITHYWKDGEWEPIEMTPNHAKQIAQIRLSMRALFL